MGLMIGTGYFYGDLQIAQIEQPAVAALVMQFVERYEPDYLDTVLGYELHESYIAGLAGNDPNYTKLRDGATYVDRYGRQQKFRGFKITDIELGNGNEVARFRSPIANYIWFKYQEHQRSFTTGVGEKIVNTENAVAANPKYKMMQVWNQMVDWNIGLREYLLANTGIYGYVAPAAHGHKLLSYINPMFS